MRLEDRSHAVRPRLGKARAQAAHDLAAVGALHDTCEEAVEVTVGEVSREVPQGGAEVVSQVPRRRGVGTWGPVDSGIGSVFNSALAAKGGGIALRVQRPRRESADVVGCEVVDQH